MRTRRLAYGLGPAEDSDLSGCDIGKDKFAPTTRMPIAMRAMPIQRAGEISSESRNAEATITAMYWAAANDWATLSGTHCKSHA